MPKIIKDLDILLMEEAKKQIQEKGYGAVTIRSIAKGCGVGVGTVYNYFPSKEMLIATYLLEDWKKCVDAITCVAKCAETPQPVLQSMYCRLVEFADRHRSVFCDETATAGFARAVGQYHTLLRSQLAQPLQKFCLGEFAAQFIAESLLTWSMAGKAFDEIYEILKKLF